MLTLVTCHYVIADLVFYGNGKLILVQTCIQFYKEQTQLLSTLHHFTTSEAVCLAVIMGLHSVQLVSLACIALLVIAVGGAKMREWQCHHNASIGVSIDYRITYYTITLLHVCGCVLHSQHALCI